MMKRVISSIATLILIVGNMNQVRAETKTLHLTLRTRDPKTNEVILKSESVEASKIGIVIVDPWNYHWCMTWTMQAGGMTPRMNKATEAARKLGMQVFWAPTDVTSMYSGWSQRQRAMAIPYLEVPSTRDYSCTFTVPVGKCLCGPGISCKVNYGEEAMDPKLKISEQDLIVAGTKELYSLCKAGGITHLIYFGGATNICLTGKPEGLSYMYGGGLETIFARDLAFAWTNYDPSKAYTPSGGNAQAADDLERAGIPTLHFIDELRKVAYWNDNWITEPIRITPSGTINRPYFFEESVTVSLEVPYLTDVVIRYTIDGSEPKATSTQYEKPLELRQTTTLRTAAFRKGKILSLNGNGYFVRLPQMPPKPDVMVSHVEQVTDLYAAVSSAASACLWYPALNKSYVGKPLRIRAIVYENGLGMRAPAYIRYLLKPEWKSFVSLAGVDDNMLDVDLGRNLAMYPKMVFKVYIDGILAAESPIMRISQEPWRFNVPIPANSRQIVLVCDDSGERSPYNLGNWVNTGFCTK